MENDQMFLFIRTGIAIIAIIILLFNLIINIFFKKNKTKLDMVIIERHGILLLFNLTYVIWSIIIEFISQAYNENVMQHSFIFIAIFYYSNIFTCLIEQYKFYTNPFRVFFMTFKQIKRRFFWELITLCLIGLGYLLWYINRRFYKDDIAIFNDSILNLVTCNIGIISLLLLITLSSGIVLIKSLSVVVSYQNSSKRNEIRKIIIDMILLFFTFTYVINEGIAYYEIIILEQKSKLIILLSSFMFQGVIIIDGLLGLISIRISAFYYYNIGKRPIGCLLQCCKFHNAYYDYRPSSNEENAKKHDKHYYLNHFQSNLQFDIDQFALEKAEYHLNVSLASISIIFNSMKMDNMIDEKNTSSRKTNTIHDSLLYREENEANIKIFNFNKHSFNEQKNNFLTNYYSSIFDSTTYDYNNSVSIQIKSFYSNEIKELIMGHHIDYDIIKNSLVAHGSKFPFLITQNSKENYFGSLKTFKLITKNKRLLIEVFPDVINEKEPNESIEKHIKYLQSEKETFLPIIIGIFKVTINHLSPFVLIISNNSLFNQSPKELFNSWQLMRFSLPKEKTLLSTSQDNNTLCIKTEDILNNDKKIKLENYASLVNVLRKDIDLLRRLNVKNISILMMYYEYDQANNKDISFEVGIPSLVGDSSKNVMKGSLSMKMSEIEHVGYQDDPYSLLNVFNMTKRKINEGIEGSYEGNKCIVYISIGEALKYNGVEMNKFDYDQLYNEFIEKFEQDVITIDHSIKRQNTGSSRNEIIKTI